MDCYVCNKSFDDENELRVHCISIHGYYRPMCQNPGLPNRNTEITKLQRDIKVYLNRMNTSKIQSEPEYVICSKIKRLKMLGEDIQVFTYSKYDDVTSERRKQLRYIARQYGINSKAFIEYDYWEEKVNPYMGYSDESVKTTNQVIDRLLAEEELINKILSEKEFSQLSIVQPKTTLGAPSKVLEIVVVDTTKPCKKCKHHKSSHQSRTSYRVDFPICTITKCEPGCDCKEYIGKQTIKKFDRELSQSISTN